MSAKRSTVHPDYYKTRGREPLGRDIVHEIHKTEYAEAQAGRGSRRPEDEENLIPGRPRAKSKTEALSQRADTRRENLQLSSKTGKRSSSKKESSSRYGTGVTPAASPVAGAFGREGDLPARNRRQQKKRRHSK
jgi:hypothetical protein